MLTIIGNHDKTGFYSTGNILVLVAGSPSAALLPIYCLKLSITLLSTFYPTEWVADFNQNKFQPTQIHCQFDPHGFDLNFESFSGIVVPFL